MAAVDTGLVRVLRGEHPLGRRRYGLIANPTAVDGALDHGVDLLCHHPEVDLCALFGPEHGLRGDAQDMVSVATSHDRRTGLPVHSLYGDTLASLAPTGSMLSGLDAVLFDIQDVGSRYYTYAWTLVLAMRACAEAGIEVIVLDRPNPIGGDRVEGGEIRDGFTSFVGLCSLANRHGLTMGELALWARAHDRLDLELSVVAMKGWRRAMYYDQTGLPWVMPSPNMPTLSTALVYPGMCLFEGTELSEGRGTTRPFEIVGAPFIDGAELAAALRGLELPGVGFRPLGFTPTFHKFAGQACGGVQLHVTDRDRFRPYLTGVSLLATIRRLWPEQFAWRTRAYEFVTEKPAIDLLTGSDELRLAIDRGASVAELAATWATAERDWADQRAPFLLYP